MIRKGLNVSDIDFLRAFCNETEKIYFKSFNDELGGNIRLLNCELNEYEAFRPQLAKLNNEGNGIFFVVNRGGQRGGEINRVTSHFLDFDFGKEDSGKKDKNGKVIYNYRNTDLIGILKEDFLLKIDKYKLEPSVVIETKNGFHLYWIIKDGQVSVFSRLESEMIEYFKKNICSFVDNKVKDLTRCLRIPDFFHLKNPKEPFKIKCIKFDTNLIYTQQDICNSIKLNYNELLGEGQKDNKKIQKKKSDNKGRITKEKNTSSKFMISSKKRVEKSSTSVIVYNYAELYSCLRQQDLLEFLDIDGCVNQNFCCIFHDDNNPSARITFKDGYYKYFCNSSNCDYSNENGLDIIDIVMKSGQLSIMGAISYLCDYFNIRLAESEWVKKQKEKYIMNFTYLNNYKDIKLKSPNLYRLIWRYLAIITQINSIALSNIHKAEFNFQNENIFYMSNRYLAKLLYKNNAGKINKYINLFCTLKLLNKINFENVPIELQEKAKTEQQGKGNIICFYTISNYSDITVDAEKIANKLIKSQFSITAMSYTYLKNILGKEIADTIYAVKIESTKRTKSLEEVMESRIINLLNEKGYFNIDMLKTKRIYIQNKYIDFNTKRRIFKRILNELIEKYNLTYKKANKTDMKEYNLDSSIYILVKVNNNSHPL